MAEKLKIRSPYDGHLIKEVDLDDEARIEEALAKADELLQKASSNTRENFHPE